MKALIADIHGNFPALHAVIDEIKKEKVEMIYCLGDVAGYYSMINECINLLMRNNVINVMGNHDNYLINGFTCRRSQSVNACIDFQRKVISSENMCWIKNSIQSIEMSEVKMVHGGWRHGNEEYLYDIPGDYFSQINGRYFFSGHTHIQCIKQLENKFYCNPGSVGQPRDGNPRASFALFDGDTITLERIEYDIDEIAQEMKREGFPEYYYKCLYTGTPIGSSYG